MPAVRDMTSGVLRTGPLEGQSSYQESFVGSNPQSRVQPIRQPNQLMMSRAAPGHFTTSNQTAFSTIVSNSPTKATSFKPAQTVTLTAPFAGTSSYQSEFPGRQPSVVVRAKAPKGDLQRSPAAPGTFATTNQMACSGILQAMQNGTLGRVSPVRQKDNGLGVTSPFEATSSYQEQFINSSPHRQPSPRRRPNPANTGVRSSTENRDFLTSNGAAFSGRVIA